MWQWRKVEPSLEDVLDDDIMKPVMRSAGMDKATLRQLLAELAGRLPGDRIRQRDERPAPCGCRLPAG